MGDERRQLVELMAESVKDLHEATNLLGLEASVIEVEETESVTKKAVIFVCVEEGHPKFPEAKRLAQEIYATYAHQRKIA